MNEDSRLKSSSATHYMCDCGNSTQNFLSHFAWEFDLHFILCILPLGTWKREWVSCTYASLLMIKMTSVVKMTTIGLGDLLISDKKTFFVFCWVQWLFHYPVLYGDPVSCAYGIVASNSGFCQVFNLSGCHIHLFLHLSHHLTGWTAWGSVYWSHWKGAVRLLCQRAVSLLRGSNVKCRW